jgi:integrase/recombinase XerD
MVGGGLMATRVPPKVMVQKLVRVLRPQRPDYDYLKKVFQYTRALVEVEPSRQPKRLPELLTDAELVALYETVWHARQFTHVVMLKLLLFTGIRNAELVQLHLMDVDLQTCQLRIRQGKGRKDRSVLFPTSFRGELAQYIERQRAQGAKYLFESNRCRPYSTRRIRQIAKHYATRAGIEKRVYPHLFRHQLITYLTKQGIISPKLQLLSGHTAEQSLAVYRELALSDVAEEYEAAMKTFPVR